MRVVLVQMRDIIQNPDINSGHVTRSLETNQGRDQSEAETRHQAAV